MAYWNHFAKQKYPTIKFKSLSVGDKFRNDFFKNKRRRSSIICIKTGPLSYVEQKSKTEHNLFSDEILEVYAFEKPTI